MLDIDELAWMTINLSFGRAEVVFHDKTDEINKNEIKNIRIVALRDGQIKRVDVESGLALVSAGDVISKGQTLVEEAPFHIESSWTGGVKAQVLAYTSYTAEFCVDRRYSYRCLTDRKLILKRLRLYNAEIPLGVKKNGFFDYELFEYAVPFELFGVTLPISLVTSEFCEAAAKTTDLNEQSVMVIIDKMQKEYERNNYADKRILSRSGELIETENGYKYVVSYFCEENIGKYEQIE